MDIKAYIDSGVLELYVAGALSEKESQDVYALTQQYPELLDEVKSIEASIVKLSAAVAPKEATPSFEAIKARFTLMNQDLLYANQIDEENRVRMHRVNLLYERLKK